MNLAQQLDAIVGNRGNHVVAVLLTAECLGFLHCSSGTHCKNACVDIAQQLGNVVGNSSNHCVAVLLTAECLGFFHSDLSYGSQGLMYNRSW